MMNDKNKQKNEKAKYDEIYVYGNAIKNIHSFKLFRV